MNLALKHALIDRQVPEYKTAQEAGIHYSRLSKFIYGLVSPSDDEKNRLSQVLGKPIKELFPSELESNSGGDANEI